MICFFFNSWEYQTSFSRYFKALSYLSSVYMYIYYVWEVICAYVIFFYGLLSAKWKLSIKSINIKWIDQDWRACISIVCDICHSDVMLCMDVIYGITELRHLLMDNIWRDVSILWQHHLLRFLLGFFFYSVWVRQAWENCHEFSAQNVLKKISKNRHINSFLCITNH